MAISAIMLITACSTPAPAPVVEAAPAIDMDALRVEIQAMEDAYSAGEQAKDADAVMAYYSDDAISYSRNREPLNGKAAIKERMEKRLAADSSGNTSVYKVVDLYADGNIAVEIGSWEDMNTAGEVINKGHYMSYFEKRDGKYVCVRDMNVTSMPEQTAPKE